MDAKRFRLCARIRTDSPLIVKSVLEEIIADYGSVELVSEGIIIRAELEGSDIDSLNRMFLAQIRRVEKKAIARTVWTSVNTAEDTSIYTKHLRLFKERKEAIILHSLEHSRDGLI
jgi:hypothetical protein